MLMEWLELLLWVLVALVVWLGLAVVIIVQAERRGPPEAAKARDGSHPSRLAAGSGPRLYADLERDHRDHGDEDPPAYIGHRCLKCGGRLFRARDGLRCPNCGLLAGRLPPTEAQMLDLERRLMEQGGDTIPVAQPYGLGAGEKWDPSILGPSKQFTDETIKKAQRRIARPPHIKYRRDGIQLSDEAQAELLKKIFGEWR